jgi:hypothetical protein
VAYVLRNPRTQTVTLDVESATFDAVLHVFRENCGGMALACNDDAVGLNPRLVLRDLAPGTYFVVVDGFGASRGSFRLRASVGTTEVCGNGQDDDGNGLVDCRDPACAMLPECRMCQPTGPEGGRGCLDGVDNDCNGAPTVTIRPARRFPQCCRPERRRGRPDGLPRRPRQRLQRARRLRRPGLRRRRACAACPTGPENTDAACSDGRDNDCDGRADCADPDCAGRGRCACVALPEQCGNGRDDDCDRLVDCADPDCAPDPVCTPMGPANDVCAGAAPLAVPATVVRGTTAGARNDYTPVVMGFPGCGGGAGPDVVYAFTVLRATPLVVEVTGEGFDPVVYVRRGDCTGGPQDGLQRRLPGPQFPRDLHRRAGHVLRRRGRLRAAGIRARLPCG